MSDLDAMRYAVLDAAEDDSATELWGHRGKLLESFRTEESARALALQRLAYGDEGVVVIDGATGLQVFPSAAASGTVARRRGRWGFDAERDRASSSRGTRN